MMMGLRKSPSRRQLLKSLGASASVPLLAQSVSATRTKQDLFAKARKAFHQRKNETAKELFQKAGVDYKIESTYVPNNSQDISTRDFFEKENSRVSLGAASDINNSDQVILMFNWNLKNYEGGDLDKSGPKDAVAIAWEGSEYGYVSGSATFEAVAHWGTSSTNVPVNLDAPPLLGDGSQNALALSVDEGANGAAMSTKRLTGHADINVRDQSGSTGQVAAEYIHTWSWMGISNIYILEKLSFTYGGIGVSVDVPKGADEHAYRKEMDMPI